MESIDINRLKKKEIISNLNPNKSDKSLSDIKSIEKNLKAVFAENVTEIYMKTKWSSDKIQKGYPSIICKLTKEAIYMQQTRAPTDPIIKYKYQIKRNEVIRNNKILTDKGKAKFFKNLIKVIEWAEAEKLEVKFK